MGEPSVYGEIKTMPGSVTGTKRNSFVAPSQQSVRASAKHQSYGNKDMKVRSSDQTLPK